MSRDSSFTHLHLRSSQHADFSDEFLRPALQAPDLQIAQEHQPPNPEDEDDVVPDQHAAFGIQRATQARREPEWRDLGLAELLASEGRRGGSARIAGSGVSGPAGGARDALNGSAGIAAARRPSESTREMIRASLGRREQAQSRGANGDVGIGGSGGMTGR